MFLLHAHKNKEYRSILKAMLRKKFALYSEEKALG
jgi:hypothetical protein